ncbi:MAG: hypothetical protein GX997_03120 [Bacteroidales bacterium]|jgi:energy-coupling factor transporter transmembrane protein EcfT|nr:hypothetical protein [Bacteroidales bacterium]
MDFIELYWIPLLLILAGLCISVFKLSRMTKSSDRKKKKDVVYQGLLLIAFGVYLLITKMFLDKTLVIICWLLGTFIVSLFVRKLKKNESDQKEMNKINEN